MINFVTILLGLIIIIPLLFVGMIILLIWKASRAGFEIPAFNFKTGEFKLMKGNMKKDDSGVYNITIFKNATASKKYDIILPPVSEDDLILEGRVSGSKRNFVAIVTYDGINWTYLTKKDLPPKILWRCKSCMTVYDQELSNCQNVLRVDDDGNKVICEGEIERLEFKIPAVQAIPQNYKLWGALDAQRRNAKYKPKKNWDRLIGFGIIFLSILAFIITVALNFVGNNNFTTALKSFKAVTCTVDTELLAQQLINATAPLAGFFLLPAKKIFGGKK